MVNEPSPQDASQVPERLSPITEHPLSPLSTLIRQARKALPLAVSSAEPDAPLRVFFSICDGAKRATVTHFSGADLDEIWAQFETWRHAQSRPDPKVRWLRIDWVNRTWDLTWQECQDAIRSSKRNYFRYGIALNEDFSQAFLEQELNSNAMLYLGNKLPHGGLNEKNFTLYGKRRFGKAFRLPSAPSDPIRLFSTQAILICPNTPPIPLHCFSGGSEGRDTGRRRIDTLDASTVESMVDQSSRFLAAQVDAKGQFVYGLHPCFDREINAYNTLRHASTVYAMLEAWEVTRNAGLKAAIDRALNHLTDKLIRRYTLPDGACVAYLQDVNNEIKLGGSAVCLLALTTYTELTGDKTHLSLLEQLAAGIQRLQDPNTGQLAHVLNADDLTIKERFRIIYYDGEAAFGLMRLYGLTKDPRWLMTVEKAFDYFIEKEHWRTHDHWLSYCVNELTRYRPEERYFRFGLQNVGDHLDFVIDRITTFPTLLELMMAAHKMILRLDRSEEHRHLLTHLDLDKFYRALETRARYLLNGFFWPEVAMYFRNPQRILGSFFIRHHSFRVRIDDVEHYLSGYIAYLKHYLRGEACAPTPSSRTIDSAQQSNSGSEPPHPAEAVLAWGGSVNLGRRQHFRAAQLGVENMLSVPELSCADLTVASLDCVVSTCGRQGVDKGEDGPFYYRARPEMLKILTSAGIDAVTVANAHSGDYGTTALLQQQDILDKLGIATAGSGPTRDDAFTAAICAIGSKRVAILSVDATQEKFAASDNEPGTAYLCPRDHEAWRTTMRDRIVQAREKADFVLVAVHWSASSTPQPQSKVRELSHVLIDVGADGVVGTTGPHLHGIEVYKSKPIIYGAGILLSETPRAWFGLSGIFRLGLDKTGISWVEYLPIGVGYGFSQRLQGDEAQKATERYAAACRELGTAVKLHGDGAVVDLKETTSSPAPCPAIKRPDRYNFETLSDFASDAAHGQAAFVPQPARIAPVTLNGLTLLGMRVSPRPITRRQMLWIETWWTSPNQLAEDLRLSYLAIPRGNSGGIEWGKSSEHDPCDWMQPTSRWQPGRIYYDHFGVRPPPLKQMTKDPLQLEVRVIGRAPNSECYLYPGLISLEISD
ncbi:CapA family protein [Vannielia sp.]|uniref:CapA family protein n=1 Tax=Vannielia sp. TaxID=2813045 RepID=UPI002609D470|nr:CapA family protein [Vannielia sp.]MDF1873639.1 CapA family protein [Vannielia sp.]